LTRLVSALLICSQRLRLIIPFSPPLRCASRIFRLGRYLVDIKPVIDLTLLQFVRQTASAFVAPVFSSHLHNTYDQFVKIYTDESKTSERAGCGMYIADRNLRYSITINKFSSSFTSELFAILHALYLAYSLQIIKVVVVTDSLSSLQSITNWNWKKHSFANKIALLYSRLSAWGYEVRFLWVPGHQNIPGNEIAAQLAKLSTDKRSSNPPKCVHYKRVNTRLNFTDMLPYLYQHSFHAWELQYQTDTRGTAYKVIFPALLRSSLSTHSLFSIIFLLCTSHRHLNHRMSRIGLHPDGLCDQCEIPETVEHVTEVCTKFSEPRRCLKYAVENLGINFSTPEILRSTAAAKHVEAFVRESGIRNRFSLLLL